MARTRQYFHVATDEGRSFPFAFSPSSTPAGATSIDFRLLLDIGTYSGAFNLSADKKCNQSNRAKCATRHDNEKSFV
jgi:hypothetical protein